VAGPDGALWFADDNSSIGRITTAGAVTYYTGSDIHRASTITEGPGGALWFANANDGIGRITIKAGVVKVKSFPTGSNRALDITAGPDGALWFTIPQLNSIGQFIPG
jgi:virginiamycin B lyase